MTNPLCIYHHGCADGVAAAWAVLMYFRDNGFEVDLHPGIYGEAPPDVTNRDVIIVDFGYKRDVLLQMADQARNITILDHHKTALKDLGDIKSLPHTIDLVFDLNRSGAMIAWQQFHPDRPAPLLFDHIQDRDLWRFQLSGTREITAAVYSYELKPETFGELVFAGCGRLLNEGRPIVRKQQNDIAAIIRNCTRTMRFDAYRVPAANVPWMYASDVAGELAKGQPFACTYYDEPTERRFSLRSAPDGIDVSEIAEYYGGGGHKHAAGFRVPLHQVGIDRPRIEPRPALPSARPETIGVELTPADLDRLENATANLQAVAPALDIDDCINLIFATGLTMTESPGGIGVVSSYGALIKAAKEAA